MPGFMYEGKGKFRSGPSNTLGGKDIFRSHRWHIAKLVGFETTGDNENFKLYAKKIKLPVMHLEQEVYKGLGAEYKFASQVKFPDAACTFYDIYGLYLQIEQIRKATFSPETGVKPASSYKGDTVFILEDPENEWLEYTLYGSFIRDLTHSELTYDGKGDFKSIDLVIAYDYFEVKKVANQSQQELEQIKKDFQQLRIELGVPTSDKQLVEVIEQPLPLI